MSSLDKFATYLHEVNISETTQRRIAEVVDFVTDLLPEGHSIKTIFISDYVDSENSRHLESLWMFAGKYAYEAKRFMFEDDIDSIVLAKNITYWNVYRTAFNPRESPSSHSRMSLEIRFGSTGIGQGEFKASGANCAYLYSLLIDTIIPNLNVVIS